MVKLHEFDKMYADANKAAEARRRYLEEETGVRLENVAKTVIDFNSVVGRNIENVIGAVQVPLGVAGPLLIKGDYANGYYYVPLATTEGALVASVNRGAKLVTESGGVRVKVLKDGMARAPVFRTETLADAVELAQWTSQHFEELKKTAESTTRFGKLKEIQPFVVGNYIWLRMVFSTGDAMGMNMVTIASEAVARYIEEKFGRAKLIALSGNMCVDKKANSVNYILGRGKTVAAEALVKREVLAKLEVTPEDVDLVNTRKNLLGSALAHSYGFNAHFANIIAAMFIATGQDAAQVVESSMGITSTEVREGGLYISIFLPSLEVGTVGGGTGLPTQREALQLLGVAGPGDPPGVNSLKLAEIVAGAVLAGELNLLVALARGELASAHKKFGRAK